MRAVAPANETFPVLQETFTDPRSSDDAASIGVQSVDPLAVRLTVKRGRLLLGTALVVAFVVALTVVFSRQGVVIETFDRRDVSIKEQERKLETYNSYSGTVTAFLERPVQLYMAIIVQVIVLRLMAGSVLQVQKPWHVGLAGIGLGAGASYLLSNGFSAVNVQARELTIRSTISAGELSIPALDPNKTSTMESSYAETRPANPSTNTILRNLILPRAAELRPICNDRDYIDALDLVEYRIPQYPWMQYVLPEAVAPTSMKIVIANSTIPANTALAADQFPMNASVAADLLVYSYLTKAYDTWGFNTTELFDDQLASEFFRKATTRRADETILPMYGPTARLTGLLPPKLGTTEQEDREWFLRRSSSIMYNVSDPLFRNESLRSWTMELSRVDIVPGSVWVDALTIEREMITPRLQTTVSKDGQTSYRVVQDLERLASPLHMSIRKAGESKDEAIDVYSVCSNRDGGDALSSTTNDDINFTEIDCKNQSMRSLLFIGRGKRLVADAVIENANVSNSEIVTGSGPGVVVNLREIYSTTVARISWTVQDLAITYNAHCGSSNGCNGIDVPLPGSGQRLVVNASSIPVEMAFPLVHSEQSPTTYSVVSVRRPQRYLLYPNKDESLFIGDILLPHNVRNLSVSPTPPRAADDKTCDPKRLGRIATVVNNHGYMESTLQPTYMTAAFFVFQSGVTRDILNQSSVKQTMLAFDANAQDVEVYVLIPSLNVTLTLAGCVLVVASIAAVALWPLWRRGGSDPLDHITNPHLIASILLNESLFPPLLVTRAVAGHTDRSGGYANADEFAIQSISLQYKRHDNLTSHKQVVRGSVGV